MHKSNGGFEFWEKEKDNIIRLYIKDNICIKQIASIYNCNYSTILNYLRKWSVFIYNDRSNAKYKVDLNYFSNINNQEKAYWVGLLLADGHLSKQGKLMLTMKDLDIIEKFKKSLSSEHPIRYDSHNNPGITISCKNINNDLLRLGFNNRKSYNVDFIKILSNIPDELMHHFVRGLFDGDGCFKVYRYDYLDKPQYHFGFTGLKEVCEFVKDFLKIDRKLVKESDLTYTCVSRNPDKIREIYNILYKDANIYLDRKYDLFQENIVRSTI